jgi:hypothetical protein
MLPVIAQGAPDCLTNAIDPEMVSGIPVFREARISIDALVNTLEARPRPTTTSLKYFQRDPQASPSNAGIL